MGFFKFFLLHFFFFIHLKVHVSGSSTPLYGTKTGYDLSLETFGSAANHELNWLELARTTGASVPEGLENCTPDGVYAVYRHGTRYPSDGDIQDVHDIIDRLQSTDINPDFYFLRDAVKIPLANASQLAESGWREMRQLAARVKTRWPQLFPDLDVQLDRYTFQSTGKARTIDSARGYVEGIVGPHQTCDTLYSTRSFSVECAEDEGNITSTSTIVPHDPIDNDPLLRFYDLWETCTMAINNGRTDMEQDRFRDGPEVGEVWQRVAQRLSVPGGTPWKISRDEVILLSKICGYDRTLYNDTRTWCQLFNTEDLYAPEYYTGLKDYWNSGYGFSINYRISCILAQDALNFLQNRTTTPMQTPLGNFKFGHSDTIIPLIALLGLFNDPLPLMASNFHDNANHTFRAANVAPFSGNIAFALYQCSSNAKVTPRVQVLHNESPVQLDFCAGQFCTMEEFQVGLQLAIGTCDFKEECAAAIDDSTTMHPGSGAQINFSVCLQFLLAYVAFVAFSFIKSS